MTVTPPAETTVPLVNDPENSVFPPVAVITSVPPVKAPPLTAPVVSTKLPRLLPVTRVLVVRS